jgi:beta-glucosidase
VGYHGVGGDLTLRQTIEVTASRSICRALTRDSLLKKFENHPKGKAFYHQLAEAFGFGNPAEADMAVRAFLNDMPVYKVCAFSEGRFTEEMLDDILRKVR